MFLPKHSSWLNQIEVIFGIVMRKVMRRGNFTSVAHLEDKLRRFLKYFNDTMAHPFEWTYTGNPQPLTAVNASAPTPTPILALKNHNSQTCPLMTRQFPFAALGNPVDQARPLSILQTI